MTSIPGTDVTPLTLEEFLAEIGAEEPPRRHYGPGPHKTGSPQSIHKQGGDATMTIAKQGGDSVQPLTGRRPVAGYMVARPPRYGTIVPAADWFDRGDQILRQFVADRIGDYKGDPDLFVGIWWDKKHAEFALDESRNVADRDMAIRLGAQWDQQSVWDVVEGKEIPTGGTGGRSGTHRHPPAGRLGDDDRGRAAGVVPADRGGHAGGLRGRGRVTDLEVLKALGDFHERRFGAYEQPREPKGTSKGGQFASKNPGAAAQIPQEAGEAFGGAGDIAALTGLDRDLADRMVAEMGSQGVTFDGSCQVLRDRLEKARGMADPYPYRKEIRRESAHEGGRKWYRRAHAEAVIIGDGDAKRGAALLAALSNQCPWDQNINAANALKDLHRDHPDASDDEIIGLFNQGLLTSKKNPERTGAMYRKYGPTGPQTDEKLRKGLAILRGGDPNTVLGGNKVRNFYNNIVAPGAGNAVTIDGHMVKVFMKGVPGMTGAERQKVGGALLNKKWATTKKGDRKGVNGVGYHFWAAAIRKVAAETGMSPEQVQAIVWNTSAGPQGVAESWDD